MLSGNISIEDDDWDSVRQSHAALTRDLERIFLSIGQGGNDFGGGSPKSANDQTVQQDGNYGFNAVTTDMLDELEARIGAEIDAIPSVTYPISIANGGTGAASPSLSLLNLQNTFANNIKYTSTGTSTWTVPSGVERVGVAIVGGGGGGASAGYSIVLNGPNRVYAGGSSGGTGSSLYAFFDVYPGEVLTINVGAGGAIGTGGTASTLVTPAGSPYRIQLFGHGGAAGQTSFISVTNATANPGDIQSITGVLDAAVLGRHCIFIGVPGVCANMGAMLITTGGVGTAAGGNSVNGTLIPGSAVTFAGSGGGGCDSASSGGSAGTDGSIVIYY